MTSKGVKLIEELNPGSKLKTAVTGKVKKGSKDAKRRKSIVRDQKVGLDQEVKPLDVDGNVKIMWALFKDKNDINEKNVIGFASFVVMTLFAIADLATSVIAEKDLIINEVVYNSFVWVTLGCFGISAVEKIKK